MPDRGALGGSAADELAEKLARARQEPAERHPPGFYEQATEWLQHPDATVRREAVRFLGRHFRKRSDAQVVLEMVAADPSPEVRTCAAQCLGGIFRSTRDHQVNQVLAATTRNREEDGGGAGGGPSRDPAHQRTMSRCCPSVESLATREDRRQKIPLAPQQALNSIPALRGRDP